MSTHLPPDQLPPPSLGDALTTAGALCHFIGANPDVAEAFCRWAEHCPGDLDVETVVGYLGQCHDLLQPDCQTPVTVDLRSLM